VQNTVTQKCYISTKFPLKLPQQGKMRKEKKAVRTTALSENKRYDNQNIWYKYSDTSANEGNSFRNHIR